MAGKIPQSFIDDLIDRTDIVELIDSRVKLKKTGRNYSACCPFHDEKTPSFSVNPDKQFYYCFGCGAGGNAVSFLMDYERSDFIETVETLASINGMQVPREHNPQAEKLQKAKKSIYDLLEQASQFYQNQLRQHPSKTQAIDYLKGRGLSGEIAKHFQLGLAPAGWDNLLKDLGTNDEQKKLLLEGGMLIEKDNGGLYDRFRDRLMFPIRDSRGRTIAFGGRVFNDDKPKYLNSPETPVFHKQHELYGLYEARQANRHLQRLVMVEGYMDVVALAQYGINYAVATLGTAAGSHHMDKVFRQCSEVIFCFDGDDAGRKAADRALEAVIPLMQAGRQAKFLFLPQGEDPDSHVRNIGSDQFVMQLDSAMSLSEYLFQQAEAGLDMSRPEDKASVVNRLMPQIQAMQAGTFQELMLRSLSEKSGLPVDDIKRLEVKALAPQPQTNSNLEHDSRPNYNDEPDYSSNPWADLPEDNDSDSEWLGRDDHSWIEQDYAPQQKSAANKQKFSHKQHDKPFRHSFDNDEDGPKQRQKIPPSQRKVKRTPIRTAISLLLFEPSLRQHIGDAIAFHEDSQVEQATAEATASPEPDERKPITSEIALFKRILESIDEQPDTNTGALMGYWLALEKDKITPLLALEHSYDTPETQIAEFQQAIEQIRHQQLRLLLKTLQEQLSQESNFEKAKILSEQFLTVSRQIKNTPAKTSE